LKSAVKKPKSIKNDITLLSTDKDFAHAAKHCKLKLWSNKNARQRQ